MKELMKRQQKAALKRAQERRNVTDIYEENIDIFTESMMGGKMALNISSSQIYAGRYHYKRQEIPNLLDTQKYTASTPGKSVKEATGVDTVTISDEGLAKAKDWREYTKDNENISHTGVNPKEELYKELNTVNNIDTASMFNCELGEVADQIQKENGLGDHSRSQEEFLTVMAKAYQVIYDRIDEEFSDPDRDPTWIRQEDGTLVEETKQDRIDALNKAYNSRAEFAAASAKVMAEIDETFHGGNYGEGFIDELQKKVMESWHNAVDEKICSGRKFPRFRITRWIWGLVRTGVQKLTNCFTDNIFWGEKER